MLQDASIDEEARAAEAERDTAFAAERALWAPPPSDITQIICHAGTALQCSADVFRWHHSRALDRGLKGMRATRALASAAKRADYLAFDISELENCDLAAADWQRLEAAFARVHRALRTVLNAAEWDYWKLGIEDRESPEFDQLSEMENMGMMARARSAVDVMGDAIQFTLDGTYDPLRARVMAAEELAHLQGSLRELGI